MRLLRTRIKICGITNEDDARAAAYAGADAIGLVFYDASPRSVTIERAQALCAALPPFVTLVGLFVDATEARIREVLDKVPLGLLQFHGKEAAQDCGRFHVPYIKAIRMRPGVDIAAMAVAYPDAQGLLLDTYRQGVPGGTGEIFDWSKVPGDLKSSIILAGGLSPGNVAEAIATVRPWAVDVSGGVECSPGRKDPGLIDRFVSAVSAADKTH